MVVDATGDSFLFSSIDQWLKAMLSVKCVAELCKGMPGFANVVSGLRLQSPATNGALRIAFSKASLEEWKQLDTQLISYQGWDSKRSSDCTHVSKHISHNKW